MSKQLDLPPTYPAFLNTLKERIRITRIKAALAANCEMLLLYWSIGRDILKKQREEGWGAKVIDRLSRDQRHEFPENKGLSPTNLRYMRTFAEAYPDEKIFHQAGGKIPWKHHCMLLDRVKNLVQRQWYMQQAIENGWSRNVLALQIESGLYEHKGKALTNFSRTLPEPDSDLAQQVTKDRYTFDFLDVSTKRHEREIERGLVDNICAFILELGKGFAFLGNQYHMEIAEKDYYLDLLFYHVRLRCYVVFELKTTEFKPEYAGKMNFYLSAVDDLLRHPDDKRSIGIVLCKINSSFAVEYALRDMTKPIGVAEYCVTRQLPDRFQKDLPTAEELTARFHSALDSMAPASSKKARLPRRRRPPP